MAKLHDEATREAVYATIADAREPRGSANGLLEPLRASTRHSHKSLEQTQLMRGLLAPSLSLVHYRHVLCVFTEFYRHVDACFAAQPLAARVFGAYHYYPRYPLLQRDLQQLGTVAPGVLEPQQTRPNWRRCFMQANEEDRQAWLQGMAYVVEGSAQGARIIAPRVARSLQIDARGGLGFFTAQIEAHNCWQALLGSFSQPDTSITKLHIVLACEAAHTMFSYLQSLAETICRGDLP